jgi:protein-S-isoprenylcysteine O-methyltransferase Ste14
VKLTDWLYLIFIIGAAVERFAERRFSHQAVRGERRMAWSYRVLHPLHIAIYLGAVAEFYGLARPVRLPVVGLGLGLFAVSLAVRLTAIRALGKFWSLHLEIRDGHRLVTEGIYRYVRHPAYLAIMLEVVALPVVGGCWFTLLFAVLAYIPMLLLRWHTEEREMVAKFGEQYQRYQREVPAFLPWRGARRKREQG